TFDFRNNVIYDYGAICSGMTGDKLKVNYVGNYIRPGPSSNRERGPIVFTKTAEAEYYLADNIVEDRPELSNDNTKLFDRVEEDGHKLVTVAAKPFAVPPVSPTSAREAFDAVLAHAGAILPVRDNVDTRILGEVKARTGHIIDSQKQV